MDIKNLTYVIKRELNKEYLNNEVVSLYEIIPGIYRITIFSEHQFNIEVIKESGNTAIVVNQGVNTVFAVIENEPISIIYNIKAVDANVVRSKFSYIVEYT